MLRRILSLFIASLFIVSLAQAGAERTGPTKIVWILVNSSSIHLRVDSNARKHSCGGGDLWRLSPGHRMFDTLYDGLLMAKHHDSTIELGGSKCGGAKLKNIDWAYVAR